MTEPRLRPQLRAPEEKVRPHDECRCAERQLAAEAKHFFQPSASARVFDSVFLPGALNLGFECRPEVLMCKAEHRKAPRYADEICDRNDKGTNANRDEP